MSDHEITSFSLEANYTGGCQSFPTQAYHPCTVESLCFLACLIKSFPVLNPSSLLQVVAINTSSTWPRLTPLIRFNQTYKDITAIQG